MILEVELGGLDSRLSAATRSTPLIAALSGTRRARSDAPVLPELPMAMSDSPMLSAIMQGASHGCERTKASKSSPC